MLHYGSARLVKSTLVALPMVLAVPNRACAGAAKASDIRFDVDQGTSNDGSPNVLALLLLAMTAGSNSRKERYS